jgi:hypothetical protein
MYWSCKLQIKLLTFLLASFLPDGTCTIDNEQFRQRIYFHPYDWFPGGIDNETRNETTSAGSTGPRSEHWGGARIAENSNV